MALDGLLLHTLVNQLQAVLPLKINHIAQISKNEIVFECFNNGKYTLLFSADSDFNRFSLTSQNYQKDANPSHFIMLLRKYCENGIIQSLKQIDLDRLVEIEISNRNDLGDLKVYRLMVELMGKYTNLVLVDQQNEILDAFVRIAPYTNTKRIIFTGAQYTYPEAKHRKNPLIQNELEPNIPLLEQFEGFSPLLSKEVEYRLSTTKQNFGEIIDEIISSKTIFQYPNHIYHVIKLTHLNQAFEQYPLINGLDTIFSHQEHQQRLKQATGNLVKLINRELKRQTKKLPKLQQQLCDSQNYQHYQELGDILLTYGQQIEKGQATVTLTDFNNNPITIELDARFNGIDNANRYYNKYQKLKKGLLHIQQQIEITQNEIEYFEDLMTQITQANLMDALQIRQELIDRKLIRDDKKPTKKKKEKKIDFNTLEYHGQIIYFGKSNIQNETITFKVANKKDTWFHVANGSGSHVVIPLPLNELNEDLIRFAANLAAYYSKYRNSSSVAVNYTSIDQIKKMPNANIGKVILGKYKTIFIDPVDPHKMP